jgi:hypothetical protein
LLDIGGALGDILEGVSGEQELVLLGGGDGDINTGAAQDAANDLLADEVADFNLVPVVLLLKVDVDGETGATESAEEFGDGALGP